MINKKIAFIIFLLAFFLSAFISYSVLGTSGGNILAPQSKYKPPSQNGSRTDDSASPNEPKTEECPLNGQLFGESKKERWQRRRPLGIMVENHTESRPQSGLSSADVIYEAVAEGGITRFLAIYYCQDANIVGPVRSARIYFVKALQEYGAYPLYAHVGGANTDGPADALGEINELGWGLYNDLNQFGVPFPNFWRDQDRLKNKDGTQIATEHTVYTNTSKLWDFAKTKRDLTNIDKKGKSWDATFEKWKFKDDAKSNERGKIINVSFGFWDLFASDYSVVWNYDVVTNSYKRKNGGSPQLDKNTGKQMEAKNVVIVFSNETAVNDGYEKGQHLFYKITGSGNGLVFQDGEVTKVTWNKKREEARMKFFDENGKEVQFVRGKIFIEILPIGNKVTY
ncbi:DUF3048 domain-containing protein [Candidatus Roizmanbacteria bacterium]|nr:DUF3048 domain-containing protein [Candidatus Roizmanbacteria bacterium]